MNGRTGDLFGAADGESAQELLLPGAWLLRGFAVAVAEQLRIAIQEIEAAAPFRQLRTPGGLAMSVGMTNCGSQGWVSDRRGYRYELLDPLSGKRWPAMPGMFLDLARAAAEAGGFPDFVPDACLVNRYAPGARMTLHQDKDERDFERPIVSVSLGLPAVFLLGGSTRSEPTIRRELCHGDVVVWGGPARLRYHGVLPVRPGHHVSVGPQRLNLTFRRAD